MKSWKIGRIVGIDIYLHFTFYLLFGFIIFSSVFSGGSMLSKTLLLTSVFSFVVLHELGHSLMARRFGIDTKEIVLYPIGGVAKILGQPKKPLEEVLIALAGPAVNIFLALVFFLLTTSISFPYRIADFLSTMLSLNLGLALFNLLPAFPMDGGRVIRAVLSYFKSPLEATKIAATIGKFFAGAFVLWGLYSSYYVLVFIGFFLWNAGSSEVKALEFQRSNQWNDFSRFRE